jgi:hypothetical protein
MSRSVDELRKTTTDLKRRTDSAETRLDAIAAALNTLDHRLTALTELSIGPVPPATRKAHTPRPPAGKAKIEKDASRRRVGSPHRKTPAAN